MPIWNRDHTLDELSHRNQGTLIDHLGIRITQIGDDFLTGEMPVDGRTRQPAGILHGGASVAFAETLGSTAANMTVDERHTLCVGMAINANHIRPVRDGLVVGTARAHHLGRTTQVWEIEIRDPQERLVCVSRLTMSVLHRA